MRGRLPQAVQVQKGPQAGNAGCKGAAAGLTSGVVGAGGARAGAAGHQLLPHCGRFLMALRQALLQGLRVLLHRVHGCVSQSPTCPASKFRHGAEWG